MRHPNVVRFVGISHHEGVQWVVTEYVAGGNLHKLLKNNSREITWKTRIKLAQDIASASMFTPFYLRDNSTKRHNICCVD